MRLGFWVYRGGLGLCPQFVQTPPRSILCLVKDSDFVRPLSCSQWPLRVWTSTTLPPLRPSLGASTASVRLRSIKCTWAVRERLWLRAWVGIVVTIVGTSVAAIITSPLLRCSATLTPPLISWRRLSITTCSSLGSARRIGSSACRAVTAARLVVRPARRARSRRLSLSRVLRVVASCAVV
jgi:hypothetical protein